MRLRALPFVELLMEMTDINQILSQINIRGKKAQ